MKKTSQNILKYDVIFEKQSVGGYTVTVPALSGCISEGETLIEAKKNIKDAIKLYLEDLAEDGEDIPVFSGITSIGQVEVEIPSITA